MEWIIPGARRSVKLPLGIWEPAGQDLEVGLARLKDLLGCAGEVGRGQPDLEFSHVPWVAATDATLDFAFKLLGSHDAGQVCVGVHWLEGT